MTDEQPRLLTITEAAKRLRVNPATVRAWADRGYIEHIRTPSGQRRFDPAVVDGYVERMRVEEGKAAA